MEIKDTVPLTTPEGWEGKAKTVSVADVRISILETLPAKSMVEIANHEARFLRVNERIADLEIAVTKLIGRSQPTGNAPLGWPTGQLTTEEIKALKARGVVVQQKPASIWHDAKTDPPKQSGAFMAVRPALLGSDIRSILWFDLGSGEWAGTLNSLSVTHWTELPPMP